MRRHKNCDENKNQLLRLKPGGNWWMQICRGNWWKRLRTAEQRFNRGIDEL